MEKVEGNAVRKKSFRYIRIFVCVCARVRVCFVGISVCADDDDDGCFTATFVHKVG